LASWLLSNFLEKTGSPVKDPSAQLPSHLSNFRFRRNADTPPTECGHLPDEKGHHYDQAAKVSPFARITVPFPSNRCPLSLEFVSPLRRAPQGRSRNLFFSVANRRAKDCFHRLYHRYQEEQSESDGGSTRGKSETDGRLSEYASKRNISKPHGKDVVIDNKTVGLSPGMTRDNYSMAAGRFDQAYSRLRDTVTEVLDRPSAYYEESWRRGVYSAVEDLSIACSDFRQARPPSEWRDFHELVVEAVNEIEQAGELLRSALATEDEALFSQATTHLKAGLSRFDELRDQMSRIGESSDGTSNGTDNSDLFSNTKQLISAMCTSDWPDDHRMQLHCAESQNRALRELRERNEYSIGINRVVFRGIREKCRNEWPSDYRMRDHCEESQIEAYVNLHE